MAIIKAAPPGACLIPTKLDDSHECDILRAQRVICGWKIEIAQKVRRQMAEGLRTLYWICLPNDATALESYTISDTVVLPTIVRQSEHQEAVYLPVGHISLDRGDWPDLEDLEPEPGLTSPDGSVLTITTLFVLPEFRKYGIATWAMLQLETEAKHAGAHAVTINTLSDKHFDATNPKMVAMWTSIGRAMPPTSTIGWYESMGYKRYRGDLSRYRNYTIDDKKEIWFDATFMRKEL